MSEKEKSAASMVQKCLEELGISSLCDWDVLVFLYRHHASLVSAEQIGRLLGYPSKLVGQSLDTLESLKLVQRSRASQGVRLYQFVYSQIYLPPEGCFQQLMALGENRAGRLLLAKELRQRGGGIHIAAKGSTKWQRAL
jgi:MarR family